MKKRVFTPLIILVFILLKACAPVGDTRNTAELQEGLKAATPTPTPLALSETTSIPDEDIVPAQLGTEFSTDFSKRSVSFDEILSGGPPKDGIPSIDEPTYVSIEQADEWIENAEPVITLNINGEARAYPIQVLMWHEIVNDSLGGKPVAITFCPLCNTAIVYDREIKELVVDFGTTGRLRYSNLIMYDRQTETWWQQGTGEAIVGELLGANLEELPAVMISWKDFKNLYPDGDVLSRDTGYSRSYGVNPYSGYDDIDRPPFLYDGPETPDVLSPMERVYTLALEDKAVAYPYRNFEQEHVINDTVGNNEIVVMWKGGTASALDANEIALGRDVGAVSAFYRGIEGGILTFVFDNGEIVDEQTNTVWNILGMGIEGELAGKQLLPAVGINHFWFSWAAFRPDTLIYGME